MCIERDILKQIDFVEVMEEFAQQKAWNKPLL